MIPSADGRFCESCAKTVVDFTAMTDKEVQEYFLVNNGKSVCGRFKNNQVHRIVIELPENVLQISMPGWMRFLVACLVIFGLSIFPFETSIAGKKTAETAFYQGTPVHKKTIQKRKKKSKYKNTFNRWDKETTIIMNEIQGFTVIVSDPVPPTSIFDSPGYVTLHSKPETHSKANLSQKSGGPEKEQPLPAPYAATEFILPGMLISSRKKSSQ